MLLLARLIAVTLHKVFLPLLHLVSHQLQVHVCSVSRENCVIGLVSQDTVVVAVEQHQQHESSNEQQAEGKQCP